MAMYEAWRWHLDKDYLKMIMCHKMCIWWAYLNSETFIATNNVYKSRIRELFNMSDANIRDIFEHHYLNEESTMVWTIDSIREYRVLTERRESPSVDNNISNDQVVEEWIREGQINEAVEEMTPEQRSIQWAIQHGGANNL
jgi:hypothetical protein